MKRNTVGRVLLAAGAALATVTAACAATDRELAKLVAEDVAKPVRPVGVDGQEEYWNVNATWFMHPPAFAFPAKKGADGYRVRIVDASGKVRLVDQTNSVVSLEKLWMDLPAGRTEVWCDAYSMWSHWTVDRHFRVFWKMAPYVPGSYPKPPRSHAEAAKLCSAYLLGMPWLRSYAETGKPDPTYKLNTYPTKMDAAVVILMTDVMRLMPERRAEALKLARAAADHLLALAQPKGAPLAGFTPTYLGEDYTSKQYAGMNMLDYPCRAGTAWLKLYGVTKDAKYLAAAKLVGETYLKLQGKDGSWYLKMYEKTGKPVGENRLHPGSVIDFMDELFAATGDVRFRQVADRAFGFYEKGPLRDWNWEGQFEDVEPTGKYENLTKHPACSLAIRIAKRWPKDAKRLAQARELLRFAEDQFVVWRRPKGEDATSLLAVFGKDWEVVPTVVEQYYYREAVDASVAKLVNTYLALYRAEGNPLDLAKAKTLGDSLVRIQRPNGRIPTIWSLGTVDNLQSDWMNCMAASIQALVNLSAETTRDDRDRVRAESDDLPPSHPEPGRSASDEYDEPVRPVGVNGQPAWNVAAKQFTYAPTFGFDSVAGAARYRFEVAGKGAVRTFEADRPTAALTPVWSAIPVGDVTVTVTGLAADGKPVGAPQTRRFWKMPPFRQGAYPKAARGYAETAALIWKYVFNRPYLQYMLEKGEPDPKYPLNSYPAKMLASQIWAMLRYAKLSPKDAPRAMRIAKAAADRLIARAQPAGSPLEYFPPTYDGRGEAGNDYLGEKFKGLHMLHYPSAAGMALLDYADASGEAACRDFAIRIADTYVRLQGEDGTWWLKMDERDGKPVCENRLVPIRVLEFLERVAKLTGGEKYARAAERAFGFIEKGPLVDWNWEGQFEDIYPAPLYANLTKHGACDVAIYLLRRFPDDARRLAQARELLRWSEDQFVVWDGRYFANNGKWTTPVALEQYHCYAPIDESAAKMMMTYLALYRAERNPRDLAKARALGDAFTRVTLDDGRLRTYWNTDRRDNEHEDWVNGQVVSAFALEDLATF